jgi:hypothetical protein
MLNKEKPHSFKPTHSFQTTTKNSMRATRQVANQVKSNPSVHRFNHVESFGEQVKIKLDKMGEHENLRKLLMQRFDK